MRSGMGSFEKRQAITAWRDQWTLYTWTSMNNAGKRALEKLEGDLNDAGLLDVYVTNAAFADPRIDKSMLLSMHDILSDVRIEAAAGLHSIDICLDKLGVELIDLDFGKLMPEMPNLEKNSAPDLHDIASKGNLKEKVFGGAIGSALSVAVGIVSAPEAVVGTVAYVAANMAKPHFHDWIRKAGSKRLANVWLGTIGEPLPVMPKVAAVFDDFAQRARSIVS